MFTAGRRLAAMRANYDMGRGIRVRSNASTCTCIYACVLIYELLDEY